MRSEVPADDGGVRQSEVVEFLMRPETYGVAEVDRIDTHISVIFLAGERAYKLKRAIRLPFLDYSTLELRRRACEEELRIDRAMAPEIYLKVTAVTQEDDGALSLAGPGRPVDWLVVMHRFDQADLFDRLATAGRLNRPLMREVADAVATLHEDADRRPDQGGTPAMTKIIDDNVAELSRFAEKGLTAREIKKYGTQARHELARCASLLETRRHNGAVRRGHGDLHLGNICLFQGRATPFDAIEFNDAIACCDVLYDLAFLVMDLWHRGFRDLANFTFNRYLAMTGEYAGLAAFPLFLSCRAAVRAKVCAMTAAVVDDAKAAAAIDDAGLYLANSIEHLNRTAPRLIAVGGMSGTGKSTLAMELAPALGITPGAVILRSDIVRKRLFGQSPETKLPADAYGEETTHRVYEQLAAQAETALRAGYTVITDAAFLRRDERASIEGLADKLGLSFHGLWLEAPDGVLLDRVTARQGDASDADAKIVEMQARYSFGEIAWSRIDASGDLASSKQQARKTLA